MDDGMEFSDGILECALLTERMEIDVLLIFVACERVFVYFVCVVVGCFYPLCQARLPTGMGGESIPYISHLICLYYIIRVHGGVLHVCDSGNEGTGWQTLERWRVH